MCINSKINRMLAAIVLPILATISSYSQSAGDSVIFKAMSDEIDRSMKELTYKDFAKPCYISFQYSREKNLKLNSELGALTGIVNFEKTGWSYRFIVGSYEINDENFVAPNLMMGNDLFDPNSSFPLEPDYFGLRRALWLASNDIYKSAGSNHREKMKLIESGKISKEMLSLPDFSEAPTVSLFIERKYEPFNTDKFKDAVTGLSAVFYQYPTISWSGADLVINQDDVYVQSSDGTSFKIPVDIAAISVSLEKENINKEPVRRTMTAFSEDPSKIPFGPVLDEDLKLFISVMDSLVVDRKLQNDYEGPVLFVGNITAEMILNNLFENTHSLIAERNNLVVKPNGSIYFEPISNKWQDQTGKRILPEGVSIIDTPKLDSYKGIDLLGDYPIDWDGVVPPDSMVLVENGILKNMFGSRTPTSVTSHSNGHNRFYFEFIGTLRYSPGPSVLQLWSDSNLEYESMKKLLLARAKEESLDYAIIVKSPDSKVSRMPYLVYKVDITTGKEEVVNDVSFETSFDLPEMKKLVFGGNGFLFNSLWNNLQYMNYGRARFMNNTPDVNGYPVSVICPKYMIVNDITVAPEDKEDLLHSGGDDISNPIR